MNCTSNVVGWVLGSALVGGLRCAPHGVELGADEVDAGASAILTREEAELLPESPLASRVGSTASATDGTRYLAGVFEGALRAGDTVLFSRGHEDVFIVHVLADGSVDWARSVGSEESERAPRITVEGERLKLLALTKGAVDCGLGPLRVWSSETFFVCTFDARGAPRSGGAFPTGRP
ncbi:MAG TPA: hypothetical protein VM925_16695 [Labilithrix sp.]|jgi:hypothetical protein|nr:hypothetical protein [Labilithrix sp.]